MISEKDDELKILKQRVESTQAELDEVTSERDEAREKLDEFQEKLTTAETSLQNHKLEVKHLKTQLVSVNDKCKLDKTTIDGNLAHITTLDDQLKKEDERRQLAEDAKAQVEETLKEKIQDLDEAEKLKGRMEAEIDALQHQSKVKGMKLKFAKQRIKALAEQKEKAERVLFILPEMQKKVEDAEKRVSDLQAELDLRDQRVREQEEEEERLKREEEDRLAREKQEWEYRTLGIGSTETVDGGFPNEYASRPNSAPVYKPSPPSSIRSRPQSYKPNSFRNGPTLNPAYIESYKAGRQATRKIKMHQEKWNNLQSDPLNRTTPSQRSPRSPNSDLFPNQMRFHGTVNGQADRQFPRVRGNGGRHAPQQPRVLVWGDVDPHAEKKLVAVGDRVLVNISNVDKPEENTQEPGLVKYIGFISGNDEDIYVGVRLDSPVGNTDGQIQGHRYFRCDSKFGRFVRLADILKTLASKVIHVPR